MGLVGTTDLRFRRLSAAEDAQSLREFHCVMMPNEWESVVDEIVRIHLPAGLETDTVDALGALGPSGELLAVAGWTPSQGRPDAWNVLVIAVRLGSQHHGLGAAMKREIVRLAGAARVPFLVSMVHVDNKPMLALNIACGAKLVPLMGQFGHTHYTCIVPVNDALAAST